MKCCRIDFGLIIFRGENRANLRSESETSIGNSVVDKLDSHGITRHNQSPSPNIPNGETKHAIETVKNVSVPLLVAVDDNFRVTVRQKPVATFLQLFPQLLVIVDLAIENYAHRILRIEHRLMTTR